MHIIASMSTIPSRISHIRPAIESVLAQTIPINHVELNVPFRSVRTNELYVIPDWMTEIGRLRLFRVDQDYGPITKIAPTLLRYQLNSDTYIWSVDDDCAYPSNQLELLLRAHRPDQHRILTRHGGEIKPDGTVQFWYGEAQVSMFEGFEGVLYPPGCIRDDFAEYVRATSANADCRSNDDIVLSLYFMRHAIPMYLYNKPSEAPYMNSGWQSYGELDALRASVGGNWQPIYKRVIDFVSTLSPSLPHE
jgi:hypothetical protein